MHYICIMEKLIINGQSASKPLSEVINSYEEGSQTSEQSRRLQKYVAEKGDINLYFLNSCKLKINKVAGIYIFITLDKPRIYVGSSKSLSDRIRQHKGLLRRKEHHNKHFQNIFNSGKELLFGILEYTTNLDEREQFWIKELDSIHSINKSIDTLRNFEDSELMRRAINKRKIPVYVYSLEGKYIEEYSGISDCARLLFNDSKYNSIISAICRGKGISFKGFRFSYKKVKNLGPYIRKANTKNANIKCSKPIIIDDVWYPSISEACRQLGIPGGDSLKYKTGKYSKYKVIKI